MDNWLRESFRKIRSTQTYDRNLFKEYTFGNTWETKVSISTPSTLKLHSNSRKFCQLDFKWKLSNDFFSSERNFFRDPKIFGIWWLSN